VMSVNILSVSIIRVWIAALSLGDILHLIDVNTFRRMF
jgi:hypothetical protein